MAVPFYVVDTETNSQTVGSKSKSLFPTAKTKVKLSCTAEARVKTSLAAAETAFINSNQGDLRTLLIELKNNKPLAGVSKVNKSNRPYTLLLTIIQFTKYLKMIWENKPRMIYLAHLSPLSIHYGRTLDTLKFAKEVKGMIFRSVSKGHVNANQIL